jgi:hypothetical protein
MSATSAATSAATCIECEAGKTSTAGSSSCSGVNTTDIRAAVDAAAYGTVTIWEAGTGVLAQTWSTVSGWGASSGEFFYGKAGTLQCTDVVTKCTIDAQGEFSAQRRVLSVQDAYGVYLTGLVIKGGYRSGGSDYTPVWLTFSEVLLVNNQLTRVRSTGVDCTSSPRPLRLLRARSGTTCSELVDTCVHSIKGAEIYNFRSPLSSPCTRPPLATCHTLPPWPTSIFDICRAM